MLTRANSSPNEHGKSLQRWSLFITENINAVIARNLRVILNILTAT